VVAAREFGVDCPSQLDPSFLAAAIAPRVYLHAITVVDWFAYAVRQDGRLVRSLSLSPDDGVIEDIGPRLPFEEPYWSGQHAAVDPEEEPEGYPFPFHPLDLGEAALRGSSSAIRSRGCRCPRAAEDRELPASELQALALEMVGVLADVTRGPC
jgi:hypothetical protein